MKSRALIALLLLFLWTLVPGIGAACGGARADEICRTRASCECCEKKPCLCEGEAPAKGERPFAAPQADLKLPMLQPNEPLWDGVAIATSIAPRADFAAAPAAADAPGNVQARFCTFLL
ncbi:MAG TPA: hypothetical protein VIM46_03300 [Luteolibacter sp.]